MALVCEYRIPALMLAATISIDLLYALLRHGHAMLCSAILYGVAKVSVQ